MADKRIDDLTQALAINDEDLFVLQQSSEAKKLKGSQLKQYAKDAVNVEVQQAATYAENAANNATNAASAKSQAQTYASNATKSASSASSSANRAAMASNSAATYAGQAESSARQAGSYASSASASATKAEAARTAAETAAGKAGKSWKPTVSAEGALSWALESNDASAPESVNIMGPQGPKGPTGATGPTGPKGDQGAQGPKGETGAKGPKGDKGDPFTYADFTAAQLAALKGEKGDKGATGEKGEKGAQGEKGDTGAKGDPGATGATGPQGPTGATGPTGPKGANGADGSNGITPTIGTNGNWYLGSTDTGKPSRGEKGDPGTCEAPVQSVNGKTGAVKLVASDVGAQSKITANGFLKGDGNGGITADKPALCVEIDEAQDGTITANKTPEEIYAAYSSGYAIYARYANWDFTVLLSSQELYPNSVTFFGPIIATDDAIYFVAVHGTSNGWNGQGIVVPLGNAVVPTTRTINSKALSDNITLTANDVSALPNVPVTASDNGKFLRVVDGVWAAATVENANGVSF